MNPIKERVTVCMAMMYLFFLFNAMMYDGLPDRISNPLLTLADTLPGHTENTHQGLWDCDYTRALFWQCGDICASAASGVFQCDCVYGS